MIKSLTILTSNCIKPATRSSIRTIIKKPKDPREPFEILRSKSVLNLVDDLSGETSSAKSRNALVKNKSIEITTPMDVTPVSGIPEKLITERRVRIYQPAKNAMQSGTDNTHKWLIEFEHQERWENPTMGWTSTGDALSNLQVTFSSAEDAARHCEKNGWSYCIEEARVRKPLKNHTQLIFHGTKEVELALNECML